MEENHRESILLTIDAIERFILCSEIAMGIIQLIALTPVFAKSIEKHRYLRTSHKGKISRLILSIQETDFTDENVS